MLVESSPQLSNQVLQFDWILSGDGLVDEDLDSVVEATLWHGEPYKFYRPAHSSALP
jgi:hypothetical protein